MHLLQNAGSDLSIREAAAIAGRSVSWVRGKRMFGPLIPTEKDGKHAVDAASLFGLLRRRRRRMKQPPIRPYLRLVVDNTKT